jgi:hypothetical protein
MSLTELESGLHLFIDTIDNNQLLQLYYGLLQREVRKKDVWSTLSADEQEAIRENINDVENNRLTSYNELMAVVSDVFLEN